MLSPCAETRAPDVAHARALNRSSVSRLYTARNHRNGLAKNQTEMTIPSGLQKNLRWMPVLMRIKEKHSATSTFFFYRRFMPVAGQLALPPHEF
jgi:hypothetical protein